MHRNDPSRKTGRQHESETVKFDVRPRFAGAPETGTIRVTAWQKDLPGDKLTRTTVIKMRT